MDAEGRIRIILCYPQELGGNVDGILRMMEAMQLSDKHGVAMSANRPHNELEDQVIVPPVDTVQDVGKSGDGENRENRVLRSVALPQKATRLIPGP